MDTNISTKFTSPEIEFAYGWNRFHLSMIGLWPDQTCKKSKVNPLIRYSGPLLGIFAMSFIVVPQALTPIFYTIALDEFIELFAAVMGSAGAVVKAFVLWRNGEDKITEGRQWIKWGMIVLAWCLSFLIDDWKRKHVAGEREAMLTKAELGRKISIGFGILMHCLVWSYVILKALPFINLRLNMENATELRRYLLYPGFFPVDLEKPMNFLFIWSAQLLATFSSTIAYTASDCFVAMLVIHLCGQIVILRQSLKNVLDDKTYLVPEVFRKNLAVIVERHVTLVKMATLIEHALNSMLLVIVLIYTVNIGLQLYGLMTVVTMRKPGHFPFLEVLFFISYINITIVHLFLYCYVGDMLIEESEALGFASYSCKWYNLSGREAEDLMIVMHRARIPLQISANIFVAFSLELFGNVLKTSMSYFSVLLTMKERIPQ